MGDFNDRLKNMEDNWEHAKELGFGTFPDGRYKFQLQSAEITESMSSGKLQIHREHLCLEGEMAGEVLHDYLQLETEWGPRFTMQWIEQMGREIPESSAGLEEVVAEIAEAAPIYDGIVKTKGGFTNLRITKLLEGKAEPVAEAGGEETSECEDFGNYEEGNEICAECADAEECKAAGGGEEVVEEETGGDEETDANSEEEHDCADFGTYDPDDSGCQECGDAEACKAATEGSGEEEGADELDELVAFCQAQEIEVTDDDDAESLTAKIKEYSWDKKQLLEDEIEMLERIGASFEEPKPAPKKSGKGKSGKSSGKGKSGKGKSKGKGKKGGKKK